MKTFKGKLQNAFFENFENLARKMTIFVHSKNF